MKILVVNGGSSSYKLALFSSSTAEKVEAPIWKAEMSWVGGEKLEDEPLAACLRKAPIPDAIGHRVVHGGADFSAPTLLTPAVLQKIEALTPLAPLHHPVHLQGMRVCRELFPAIPQVGVFDTAFHSTLPEVVKTYPIPYKWREKGIYKYGFHGINHHYCTWRMRQLVGRDAFRLVNCHLGSGCSLAAMQDGISINTSMGMTPLEGLMMATRCGSIDPGVLLYLMQNEGVTLEALERMLYSESGLQGIGDTADMRTLLQNPSPKNSFAVAMYLHRIICGIGSMIASLEGIDCLCFTGGIGQNSAFIREKVVKAFAFLGIELSPENNHSGPSDRCISSPASKVAVWVLAAQEEWMIAHQTQESIGLDRIGLT